MKPQRIQRKRTKGWKMPPNTIYVGRPSKWGNPFAQKKVIPNELVLYVERADGVNLKGISNLRIYDVGTIVKAYTWWIIEQPYLMCSLAEIRGKNLCCWCPIDQPCHADVLLEIANEI